MVVYPEETLFFRRFLPAVEGKSVDERLALADDLLIHFFQWNQENPPEHQKDYPDRDYSNIDFDQVHHFLSDSIRQRGDCDKAYLEGAVMAFGMATGLLTEATRYWVEKTPYNEYYSDQIFDWWPVAKCIHVVRDPRDNYVSYKLKQPGWTVKTFANNWNRSTNAGLNNQRKFGKARYHILRFEDLLLNPESETKRLSAFLDLEWSESFLQPTRVGSAWGGNSMFAQTYRSISQDPIGRWKTNTSMRDLVMLQTITNKTMTAIGYEQEKIPMKWFNVEDRIKIMREKFVNWLKFG